MQDLYSVIFEQICCTTLYICNCVSVILLVHEQSVLFPSNEGDTVQNRTFISLNFVIKVKISLVPLGENTSYL